MPAVREYLDLRRSFGYVLAGQDRPLADFAGYLERIGAETVTIAAALAWAVEPETTPLRHYQRLAMVRGFATYLHAIDPRCEIPPKDLLPEGRRRVPPHIYSDAEIAALMSASRLLRPAFRAATIETAIGLLVVTGMRSGELARLERSDVDLRTGRLRIIATKFQKSRELALHPSTVEVLNTYRRERDRYLAAPGERGLLPLVSGNPALPGRLERSFAWLVDETGLAPPPGSRARRPRLHDASTASLSPPCSAGTATAWTSNRSSQRCRLSSGMQIRHRRTGI